MNTRMIFGCILLCVVPFAGFALTLNVGSDSGAPGQEVQISITLDNAIDVGNFGFTVLYNTDRLSLVTVDKGEATDDWAIVNGTEVFEGAAIVGWRSTGTNVNGSGQEICVIRLDIASDAPSGIVALNATVLTGDIEDAITNDGIVTIIGPTPTPTPTPGLQVLSIGNATGSPDSDVIVSVLLDTPTDVTSWSFDMSFDTTKLQYVSVDKGTATQDWNLVSGSGIPTGASITGYGGCSCTALNGSDLEICRVRLHIAPEAPIGTILLNASNLDGGILGGIVVPGNVSVSVLTPPYTFSFDTDNEDWTFAGKISDYDTPLSQYTAGSIGLSPNNSSNCFSFWYSPNVMIAQGKTYRARWSVKSSVSNPDLAPEFRLRANQTGNWSAWIRDVNSNLDAAPSSTNPRQYDLIIIPSMDTATDNLQFSFDILGFNTGDDLTSWLYLDTLSIQEVTISE